MWKCTITLCKCYWIKLVVIYYIWLQTCCSDRLFKPLSTNSKGWFPHKILWYIVKVFTLHWGPGCFEEDLRHRDNGKGSIRKASCCDLDSDESRNAAGLSTQRTGRPADTPDIKTLYCQPSFPLHLLYNLCESSIWTHLFFLFLHL